jgi:hypothetical protein
MFMGASKFIPVGRNVKKIRNLIPRLVSVSAVLSVHHLKLNQRINVAANVPIWDFVDSRKCGISKHVVVSAFPRTTLTREQVSAEGNAIKFVTSLGPAMTILANANALLQEN